MRLPAKCFVNATVDCVMLLLGIERVLHGESRLEFTNLPGLGRVDRQGNFVMASHGGRKPVLLVQTAKLAHSVFLAICQF
jgi:hypothetical protein